jgi:hypothetical protein
LGILRANGVPITETQLWEMAVQMVGPMRRSQSAVQRAAIAYVAAETGLFLAPSPPVYPIEALVTLLQRVAGSTLAGGGGVTTTVTPTTRRDTMVVEEIGKRMVRAAERHAQQPARDLIKETADDMAGLAWARVLTGPTSCYFCAMLASRGPVYTSETAALYRGGQRVDKYHDGCDCEAVLVPNYSTWEGRDAHRRLEELWEESTRKTSGKRSMNAFRRAYEAQTRSGQFRPGSFKRSAQAA